MGKINVEGLGVVEIEGDVPTLEEQQAIKENYNRITTEQAAAQRVDKNIDAWTTGQVARFGIEAGLGIAASIYTGGLALPVIAARGGMLALPFARQLGISTLASAAGSGTGAVVAQPFDPKSDIGKEVIRASIEGAVGEAIGAPLAIGAVGGAKYVSKYFGNRSPKEVADVLANADTAETVLKTKKPLVELLPGAEEAEAGLKAQAALIKADPEKYAERVGEIPGQLSAQGKAKLLAIADEAEKGLTLGVKTRSKTADIIETIGEKSFIGNDILKRKESLSLVGDTAVDDMVNKFTAGLNNQQVGDMYIEALTGSNTAFKAAARKYYGAVDQAIVDSGLKSSLVLPMDSIKKESLSQLNQYGLKNSVISTVNKEIQSKQPFLTFKQADALRSSLLEERRAALRAGQTQTAGSLDQIRKQLDNVLEKDLDIPEAVKIAQKTANNFYKDGSDVFRDTVVKKILKDKNPDDVFGLIVKAGDKPYVLKETFNQLDQMTKLKDKEGIELLTKAESENLKNRIKGQFLANVVKNSESTDRVYGNFFDADKFTKNLNKFRNSKEVLFSPDELKEITKIEKQLAFSQGAISRKGGTPGAIFIQMKQAGAMGTLLQFGLAGGAGLGFGLAPAAAILLGPAALNKIMLSPKINSLLFKQYNKKEIANMTPAKAGVIYRQLLGRMADEGVINSEELVKYSEMSKQTEKDLIKSGIKTAKDAKIAGAVPQYIAPAKVNTQVTQPNVNVLQAQPSKPIAVAPQVVAPKPVAGGITNIPQERIDQYTNLFGRI
jgi:hypothetical protein